MDVYLAFLSSLLFARKLLDSFLGINVKRDTSGRLSKAFDAASMQIA